MNTRIPQTSPLASYLAAREDIDAAVKAAIESGWYILGEQVKEFEREFAAFCGVAHAVGVASGTDALTLALRACGIGAGDEVLTVSHTAVATVCAIVNAGATPRLVDVDPDTFCMDAAQAERRLTGRTRAIVPVHLYGLPAEMTALLALARDHGLRVIEDCAQAHGAECLTGGRWKVEGGRRQEAGTGGNSPPSWTKVGALGDAAAFSFYPTKNLGACGDGGCVVSGDPGIAERVRLLRQYGWKERYVSVCHGTNSRLDELQAAILRVRLRRLDADNAARIAVAGIYDRLLAGTPVRTPVVPPGRRHVYHQYVVRVANRDAVRARLAECGVETAIHYPVPVHLQAAYAHLAPAGSLPVTERLCAEILSLPMYPQLDQTKAEFVATALLRTAQA